MNGLTPVYYVGLDFTKVLKDASNELKVDKVHAYWKANGYRLPSEGEWQHAARYINRRRRTPYNYAIGANAEYYKRQFK